jgi:hypothetical protein
MEEWLHLVTKDVVVIIDAMALIIVAIGTAEAFSGCGWHFPARWRTGGSVRSWCATDSGSSRASLSSSQPTSSGRRLRWQEVG